MKFVIGLFFVTLVTNVTRAQCYTEDTITTPALFSITCGERDNYTPIINDHTPIVTVRIAFHVFAKSDSTENFQNNPTDKSYLQNIVNNANERLSNLGILNIGNSPYIQDSRVRLYLENIYFHLNDTDAFFLPSSSSSMYTKYIVNDYDNYSMTEDEKYNVHHILLRAEDGGHSGGRQVGGLGYQGHIVHAGWYGHYLTYGYNSSHWGSVGNFIHELGHAFGLKHNFHNGPNGNQCDDCSDNDPINLPCPIEASSNNYMDYFPGGYADMDPGFSQCQLSTMHQYLSGKLGTIGRTVLKDYCVTDRTKNIEINGSFTWNSHKKMRGDLIINSGSTLTVKCKLHMPENAKIIIKQNGRLIIDEGIITNECNTFWQGIEVWGTTDKNQYPANHPTHQGLLIVKNGGIIENAHHAVSNWRKDHWDQIGGVIQVTNGIFRNNRRDVEFMSYQNYSQTYSQEYPNLSFFTDTDFVSDDDFIEQNLPLQSHVSMWDVDGIIFKNCHFKNEITTNKETSSAPRRGIYSIDAGYQILPKCTALSVPIGQACPTAQLFKSSFSGLEIGIEASSAGTTETITVRQTDFLDNIFGILVNEMDHVSLTQNTFEIGNAGYSNNPYFGLGLGVKIDNSTGFKIEENTIDSDLSSGLQVGVWVNNSGSDDNRVYKNDIQNLYLALHSTGKNHNSNLQKGLQFLCNTLQDNTIAIGVGSSPTNDGIRLYQGDFSPSKSAGNTFISNDTDIHNAANSIIYIHNGGNKEPNTYTGLVTLQSTTTANTCPSSFGPPIIFEQFSSVIDSLGLIFSDLTDSYENLKYSYTALIDNGNTETFKENIKLSWSADAWLLRSNLLDNSPYLSSEVLLKSAEQNVLPNGMLLEVLLANPDATKGEHFIEKLNEATQYNFPEYMQDYVRANYDLLTLRTEMEGQLASIHSNRADIKDWITYLVKSKDEYQTNDRFNAINLGQELYSKVGLVDYYVSEKHFSQADSVLLAIQTDKKYQDELSLIENLEDYLNFRSDLNTRNLAQLDSSEISYLQDLAQGTSRASGYAKNILCYFYDICFEPELALLNTENKMLPTPTKNTKDLANVLYDFKIFPNPAKEYVSITWEIFDNLVETTYSITDLSGKTHLQGSINSNKGEQQIDTRMLKEGLYILNINNNNQIKTSKKLIIINQLD